jgi:hypothetical protein
MAECKSAPQRHDPDMARDRRIFATLTQSRHGSIP